jgi:hypothetical protein
MSEAFCANLPDSLLDGASAWHREQDEQPAILGRSEA